MSYGGLYDIVIEKTIDEAHRMIGEELFYDIFQDNYQQFLDKMKLDINEWEALCKQCTEKDMKFGTFEHANVDLSNKIENFESFLESSFKLERVASIRTIYDDLYGMIKNSKINSERIIQSNESKLQELNAESSDVARNYEKEKKQNETIAQEVNRKKIDLKAKKIEFDIIKDEYEAWLESSQQKKKNLIEKRIELANLNNESDLLQAELDFTNEEIARIGDDELKCSLLVVLLEGFHQKHISTFKLLLYSLIILLGAITISSVFTCVHPFANDIESKHLLLLWFLPYILAFLSCGITIKHCDTIFFLSDRRILITILNLTFITLSILYYFYWAKLVVCLVLRALQGFIVGFLSIIYPASLFQLGKTKQPLYLLSFFLVSFAFGVLFCVPIKQKWPLYVVIFPGLQTILIWFINKSSFNFVNLKVDFGSDFKFHLEFLVIVLHILQPFLGPFTL